MLDEAERRSQDRTPIGRHVATILLDGACEYAMGLAAAELGVPVNRDVSFHALYTKLVDTRIGTGWATGSWKGVSELHGSRNMAQHEGTSVDGDGLLRWSIDAGTFVRSLCHATFHVELRELCLADAILTPGVREPLLDAERSLDAADAARAFASAMAGLDEARAYWRMQRADAHGPYGVTTTPGLAGGVTVGSFIGANPILDLVEVLPFAPDLGEYYWLLARRAEFEDYAQPEAVPSLEDASRSFRFAFFWSLRWEAFAVGYTWRRWPAAAVYDPPESGRENGPPLLWSVRKVEGARARLDEDPVFSIVLQLADLPESHRTEWAGFLQRKMNELAPKDAAGIPTDYVRVADNGLVYITQVPGDRDPDELTARINRAIVESHAEFDQSLSAEAEWDGQHDQLLEPYKSALAAVTLGERQPLLGAISAHGLANDFVVTGTLAIDDDGWLQHDVLGGVAHHLGGYDGAVRYDDGNRHLSFLSSLTPTRAAELASLIAADVLAARAKRASAQNELDAMQDRLESGLQQSIAAQREKTSHEEPEGQA
jgi:hypothetical protein